MIERLLQHFFPGCEEHLPDDRLASLIGDDLSVRERLTARLHLSTCWSCRLRREDLEERRAEEVLTFYRKAAHGRTLRIADKPREEFLGKLQERLKPGSVNAVRPVWRSSRRYSLRDIKPAFAISSVCAMAAALLCFSIWRVQSIPKLTSVALLNRAEEWDTAQLHGAADVVYQKVRISSSGGTVQREIYRDLRGKRRQREVTLTSYQAGLEGTLAEAGASWNEPISAGDYQRWRDRQRAATDSISREGDHLLTLTTHVADSDIVAESLTVRDSDFHPVRRTIDLRNAGTVEIAELDFRVLPWNAVSDDIFEPLAMEHIAMSTERLRPLDMPKLPRLLTPLQLDEAELSARLLLNQLRADRGEQIEVERAPQEVVIRGVVDTDDRKRELRQQIALLPHVRFAVQSASEFRSTPETGTSIPVQIATMENHASALETYMRQRGRSIAESNATTQRLANATLSVSQESRAITDLQSRFLDGDEKRSLIAEATLTELIYTHRDRLRTALKEEKHLLDQMLTAPDATSRESIPGSLLSVEASRNLALLKELTQTERAPARGAEEILLEMAACTDDVSAASNRLSVTPQGTATALSGGK